MTPSRFFPHTSDRVVKIARVAAAVAVVTGIVAVLSLPVSTLRSTLSMPVHNTPVPTTNAYGFSTSLDGLTDAQLNTKLDALHATGSDWVRYDLSWDTVQAGGASSYDWSAYDRIAKAVSARDMHAVMVIDFTPSWARSSSCNSSKMCPPASPAAYGKFAGLAVARYQSYGLRDWEIWNEPNISYRYHPKVDPAGYTAILKSAYTAIKAADPAATVITGGTAPSETNATNDAPADFLKALYADGAGGYFDAVAAHPYTYPNSPAANLPDAWGQMTTMHELMAQHGDGSKSIWITEFGAPTDGPDVASDHVTEAQQAQILSDALSIAHGYSWTGPFFWYDYQDSGTSTADSENFYGLVRSDGTHKPSYDVWVSSIASAAK